MAVPRLLHPVKIVIEQLDESNTIYDEDTREPIKQSTRVLRDPIDGQVAWEIKDNVVLTEGGTRLDAKGYILFRYIDLNRENIILAKQDKIIKIGWQEVNLYIVAFKPAGHYTDQGGATMVKAYFSDRAPSRI